MSDSNQIARCPFCNAPWGTCAHIRILLEWEKEALAREGQEDMWGGGVSGNIGQSAKPGLKN